MCRGNSQYTACTGLQATLPAVTGRRQVFIEFQRCHGWLPSGEDVPAVAGQSQAPMRFPFHEVVIFMGPVGMPGIPSIPSIFGISMIISMEPETVFP